MSTQRPDALKFLAPGWFAVVMGLCGLAMAWLRAAPLMGDVSSAGGLAIAVLAALAFVVVLIASWLRWLRHPEALAEDLRHPVRHAMVATLPVSLILLATLGVSLLGPLVWLEALWWGGSLAQLAVTVWLLARWLRPGKELGLGWPAVTPALFIPVVGNVLAPLAGVTLGHGNWAAAQFGIGLLLWPVLVALLVVRLAVQGVWPERVLPLVFISVAPPAVIGTGLLQLGAPPALAWMAWGVALLFLLWSASAFKRMLAQPFSIQFWALSFPLASFAGLTLVLTHLSDSRGLQTLAMLALALASFVIAALLVATFKGLRDGTLLQPEPVAMVATSAGTGSQPG